MCFYPYKLLCFPLNTLLHYFLLPVRSLFQLSFSLISWPLHFTPNSIVEISIFSSTFGLLDCFIFTVLMGPALRVLLCCDFFFVMDFHFCSDFDYPSAEIPHFVFLMIVAASTGNVQSSCLTLLPD